MLQGCLRLLITPLARQSFWLIHLKHSHRVMRSFRLVCYPGTAGEEAPPKQGSYPELYHNRTFWKAHPKAQSRREGHCWSYGRLLPAHVLARPCLGLSSGRWRLRNEQRCVQRPQSHQGGIGGMRQRIDRLVPADHRTSVNGLLNSAGTDLYIPRAGQTMSGPAPVSRISRHARSTGV